MYRLSTVGCAWLLVAALLPMLVLGQRQAPMLDDEKEALRLAPLAERDNDTEFIAALRKLQKEHGDFHVLSCLLRLLRNEKWEVQASAVDACGALNLDMQPILSQVRKSLHNGQVAAKIKAGKRVGKLAEALARHVIQETNTVARSDASGALSALGPQGKGAIPILIAGLKSKQTEIRWYATCLLGDYGAESRDAVPALIEFARTKPAMGAKKAVIDDNDLRNAAATALGRIGTQADEVVPLLVKMLDEREFDTRHRAAYALGRFGSKAQPAIPRLVELLGDKNLEGPFCATSGIPPSHWAGSALISVGKTSIPALTAALDNENPAIRRHAANALMYFGKDALPAIPNLLTAAKADDAGVRRQAIGALASLKLRLDLSLPIIIEALKHEDAKTRVVAAASLSFFGVDALPALPGLIEAANSDEAELRRQAIWTLGYLKLRPDLTVPAFIAGLRQADVETRQNSAEALGRLGTDAKSATDALRVALADTDEDVRLLAASALKRVQGMDEDASNEFNE